MKITSWQSQEYLWIVIDRNWSRNCCDLTRFTLSCLQPGTATNFPDWELSEIGAPHNAVVHASGCSLNVDFRGGWLPTSMIQEMNWDLGHCLQGLPSLSLWSQVPLECSFPMRSFLPRHVKGKEAEFGFRQIGGWILVLYLAPWMTFDESLHLLALVKIKWLPGKIWNYIIHIKHSARCLAHGCGILGKLLHFSELHFPYLSSWVNST